MDINASDLWFLGSGFVFGVSCGYGFAKILSKKTKKSRKEYKRLLASQALELQGSRDKIIELERELAQRLKPSDERAYIDLVESLKRACESKDREIHSLKKRINTSRYAR